MSERLTGLLLGLRYALAGERGASTVEYALIVSVVAAAVLGIASGAVQSVFEAAFDKISI